VKLHEFPRYALTFGPSPVHLLDRLTKHLGGATLWAKREDCSSGLAFGGNKVRKLEYLVPDALSKGADTLVSIGVSSPTTPGRSRLSRPSLASSAAWSRRSGWTGMTRSTTR